MKRQITTLLACLLVGYASANVFVFPSREVGPIKLMNAVNNGPAGAPGSGASQTRGNIDDWRAAKIPFARTHDASFSASYGAEHTVDITAIFPDFSKNVDDPSSYGFVITDWYLKRILDNGTGVFFRLGQRIEHDIKKYGIYPPKDFKKWAQICEHIIRHYNEGWADGHEWNIRYWEIWNEPECNADDWNTNPLTWGGTEQQFFDFYTIAAKHLKKCFPHLLIGGPALCWDEQWADRFLAHTEKHEVPIDFFSWHTYTTDPKEASAKAVRIRKLMDAHGYTKAESILNEWNYIRNWTDEYPYSVKMIHGLKGAAYIAATMTACQNAPVDMLMYYDARPETVFNGLFDLYTFQPLPTYYSIYAWSRLASLGKQVKVETKEEDIYVVAAKGEDGTVRTLVTRYNDNDNINRGKMVKIHIEGAKDGEAVGHVMNGTKLYSETILDVRNGVVTIKLDPNAVVMIETRL